MLLREDVISILRNHFTASILFADGSVNRKELASIVFNNTDELRFLNSIIHPLVGKDFEEWCKGHLLDDIIVHEAAILSIVLKVYHILNRYWINDPASHIAANY